MKRYLSLLTLMLAIAGSLSGQDGFGDIFGDAQGTAPTGPLEFSGAAGFEARSFFDDSWDSERTFRPYVNLHIKALSDIAEADVSLKADGSDMNALPTPLDVIDEMMLRVFFPIGYLDLGLGKVEWGKGDGVHVVDPLNPLDQSGVPDRDINEIKRPELMARLDFYLGSSGQLELVYKPWFHPLETASSGRWMIEDPAAVAGTWIVPDTETNAYGQAAARITGTLGRFDLGAMAYYGFMSEPGLKLVLGGGFNPLDPADWTATVIYTRATLFGAEAGWALGPFTFRLEGGYWLSEDRDGTSPWLYNDRAVWLAGADVMIPGTTIFISVQEFGSYVVNFDDANPLDADLGMSYGGQPAANTLVAAVEGNFFRDKLKIRLGGLYLIEAGGYLILPALAWDIGDDLTVTAEGQIMGGGDMGPNPYYAWRNNDSVSIAIEYRF